MLEQEIVRLESNPDKKIKVVVSIVHGVVFVCSAQNPPTSGRTYTTNTLRRSWSALGRTASLFHAHPSHSMPRHENSCVGDTQ